MVTAASAIRAYGQANPVFTGTITGLTNGDNITATYSTTATVNSPVGTYPIIPSLVDPNDRETNYTVTLIDGTLTVGSVLTWSNPTPIIYGTALSTNQLNATADVPGSFTYSPTNGSVLNAGTNTLSVIFTPTDTVDYNSVTNTVNLVVLKAPLTITAASTTWIYGEANPVLTGTIIGLTNGDNITAAYSTTATANSPRGMYPIIPSLVDPNDRQTNYTVGLVDGTLTIVSLPIILTQPVSQGVVVGVTTNVTFSVTVSGSGPFSYP